MKVTLNAITGFESAFQAMYISKRNWNEELVEEIRDICDSVLNRDGSIRNIETIDKDKLIRFQSMLDMVCRMTKKHITVGRFIDFSFSVEGLHRGGQDDWDSHAKRFGNRIIRSSTRLADFGNEKSDYYKNKILTTDEVLAVLGIEQPESIVVNGIKYVKAVNGYVIEEYKDSRDVKRGLHMLSIPSNFTFKVDLTEFSHVYKERNADGTANPEVKELAEECLSKIYEQHHQFNKELMLAIQN